MVPERGEELSPGAQMEGFLRFTEKVGQEERRCRCDPGRWTVGAKESSDLKSW